MARIGRKAKFKGTGGKPSQKPPEKPIGSAPTIEVMQPDELKIGGCYFSWLCENCGKMLALHGVGPGFKAEPIGHNVVTIICPHCGAKRHYSINERREREYAPGPD